MRSNDRNNDKNSESVAVLGFVYPPVGVSDALTLAARVVAPTSRALPFNPQSAIRPASPIGFAVASNPQSCFGCVLAIMFMFFMVSPIFAGGQVFDSPEKVFLNQVDADSLGSLGLESGGRMTILDTVAREELQRMTGGESIDGLPSAVAYLELFFNSGAYLDKPLLKVSDARLRQILIAGLPASARDEFARSGMLAPAAMLNEQSAAILLQAGRASVEDIKRASAIPSQFEALRRLAADAELRGATGGLGNRFLAFLAEDELLFIADNAGQRMPLTIVLSDWPEWRQTPSSIPEMSEPMKQAAGELVKLRDAWRTRDSAEVNRSIHAVQAALSQSGGYPSPAAGKLEIVYNSSHRGTATAAGFAAAMVLLIIAVAGGRRWARRAGMIVLTATTLTLLAGFIARWILSGQPWYLPPIMNMFEAVIGSALIAAILAIIIELFWRKNILALAAACYATGATMCGFLFPQGMRAGISAMPGILNSPIMAIHVSFIIVGHALVGMTFCISIVYLLTLTSRRSRQGAWSSGADLSGGGAADAGMLATIDRCNLIVAQLAAWMVIVGTVLGAYWADFSWGHWWDWDIKETWALMTCLAFVAILHLRYAVGEKSRGVLTAILCIIGCAIMLFNWLAVNYFFAGKHSYA